MPKENDTDKNGTVRQEFATRVSGITPGDMARYLGRRYRQAEKGRPDSEAFDNAVEEYADFLQAVLRLRPQDKQIAGFLAYAEWVLGKRSAPETVNLMMDALKEYRPSMLEEAMNNIEKTIRLSREMEKYYPVDPPEVLLLTHKPHLRLLFPVAAPDVPDEDLTPPRGMVRRAYGFDKLDPPFSL